MADFLRVVGKDEAEPERDREQEQPWIGDDQPDQNRQEEDHPARTHALGLFLLFAHPPHRRDAI